MRNQLLTALIVFAIAVAPAASIAQPAITVKTTEDHKVVETVKGQIDTFALPTKEEMAQKKITENLKKIEDSKKAKSIVKVEARANFTALYAAAGAKFGVDPAILAAVHFVETGGRGDTTIRSYAGAQGPMQFMPATFRAYGVDGDGDGIVNIHDVDDAMYSAANYLAANGAANGRITNALFRYNHSMTYVNKVLNIARGYGYNG